MNANDPSTSPVSRQWAACALAAAIVAAATPALAQRAQTAPGTAPANGAAAAPGTVSKQIQVSVGGSTVVRPPWPAKRVAVADPKVADIQVLSPNQVLVNGKSVGATDLFIWNGNEEVWEGRISVDMDQTAIRDELQRLFPKSRLEVRQSRDMLIVSGTLARAEQAEALHRYLDATGIKYLDMTRVAGVQQVQIRVRVAEASRTAIKTLGINAYFGGSSFFGGSTIGPDGGGPLVPINVGPAPNSPVGANAFQFNSTPNISNAVTLFAGVPAADLEVFVQALAENQYIRVLAEPSLVALSGQEASFLAGGEFPIPVVQASASTTAITIEYKEFGVRLRFKPTVLGDGTIRMNVAPEVSQLSTGPGSVQIQGFNIPALITRRAETTLEMGSGQTFAMAGLLNQTVEARSSKVPGLGDVPILGALFRSVRYKTGDTELVVLVTAELAEPVSLAGIPPLPGDLHVPPNDWELYALGDIHGRIPPKIAATDAQSLRAAGLHRLKGPGAWATFDSPRAASRAPMNAPANAPTNAPANAPNPQPAPDAASDTR